MATSSITESFVISGEERIERFLKAMEENAKLPPLEVQVNYKELTDPDEIIEFMERRKMRARHE